MDHTIVHFEIPADDLDRAAGEKKHLVPTVALADDHVAGQAHERRHVERDVAHERGRRLAEQGHVEHEVAAQVQLIASSNPPPVSRESSNRPPRRIPPPVQEPERPPQASRSNGRGGSRTEPSRESEVHDPVLRVWAEASREL